MPARPPHHKQAYPFSCVPACLKMVLEYHGHKVTEAELRALCECDEDGTLPSNVVKAAKHFGFSQSTTAYLQLDELKEVFTQKIFPIVYIEIQIGNIYVTHAVVVVEITTKKAVVLDPDIEENNGEREISLEDFNQQWSATNGRTILIE